MQVSIGYDLRGLTSRGAYPKSKRKQTAFFSLFLLVLNGIIYYLSLPFEGWSNSSLSISSLFIFGAMKLTAEQSADLPFPIGCKFCNVEYVTHTF